MSKVLVREPIAEAGVRLLRERGFDVDVDGDSDLAETIGEYDAIVVRSATKVTAELIRAPTSSRSSAVRGSASTTSTLPPPRDAGSS